MLVVEDEARARDRSAPRLYGRIAGYASTFDPQPGSGRPPGLRRAMDLALASAGVTAEQISAVFADAAGVPDLDRQEAEAISAIFGPRGVPVTAPKTMTGRLNAGGAALDMASALLSIRDGVLPPTVAVTELAPGCDLDLVCGAPREAAVSAVLVAARGYGGFNAAIVLTQVS